MEGFFTATNQGIHETLGRLSSFDQNLALIPSAFEQPMRLEASTGLDKAMSMPLPSPGAAFDHVARTDAPLTPLETLANLVARECVPLTPFETLVSCAAWLNTKHSQRQNGDQQTAQQEESTGSADSMGREPRSDAPVKLLHTKPTRVCTAEALHPYQAGLQRQRPVPPSRVADKHEFDVSHVQRTEGWLWQSVEINAFCSPKRPSRTLDALRTAPAKRRSRCQIPAPSSCFVEWHGFGVTHTQVAEGSMRRSDAADAFRSPPRPHCTLAKPRSRRSSSFCHPLWRHRTLPPAFQRALGEFFVQLKHSSE